MAQPPTQVSRDGTFSAAIVGCGNIGSFLTHQLCSLEGLSRLVFIDHDRYEERNLRNQNIESRDVGLPKVTVQACAARRQRPDLEVYTIRDRVGAAPLGRLRVDVIATCLDSRVSRLVASERAWHLNVAVVDAGVDADGSLVRVSTFLPGPRLPCYQCSADDRFYETIEAVYACDGNASRPTGAPSSLGAIAAAVQARECRRLLERGPGACESRQILMDCEHYKTYVTRLRHNANCRFDHAIWPIRSLRGRVASVTLAALLDGAAGPRRDGGTWLRTSQRFVTRVACSCCGWARDVLRLEHRLRRAHRRCESCGGTMDPIGFLLEDRLNLYALSGPGLRTSLGDIGFRKHDVLSVHTAGKEIHYELSDN